MRTVHRISWELHFGPIPEGLGVLHHCDNRRCVRPDHLFIGTAKDNLWDAAAKERLALHLRKLTVSQVRSIRAALASGCHPQRLADQYGVTQQAIRSIRARRSYGWLPEVASGDPNAR